MAKIFYTLDEAVGKLGCEEAALKQAVRDGKLREFRDAGKVNYKVDEIDKLAAGGELGGGGAAPAPGPTADSGVGGGSADESMALSLDAGDQSSSLGSINLSDDAKEEENPMPDLSASGSLGLGLSSTGSIGLADTGVNLGDLSKDSGGASLSELSGSLGLMDSGINLASGGEDMVSLDDDEEAGSDDKTSAGAGKDDTVVSSVGVSVFDEEDLDASADPMAKTVVTGSDAGGTGLEGIGSGSGLLDLTRESDDTSLGAELLDEIYPADEGGGTVDLGGSTRAGLEADAEGTGIAALEEVVEAAPAVEEPKGKGKQKKGKKDKAPKVKAPRREPTGAVDLVASSASGLLALALVVLCFAGLSVASMMRGVWPSLLNFVYGRLWVFGLGALAVALLVMGSGWVLARRSSS